MKFLIVLAFICVLVTGIPIDLSEDESELNSENLLESDEYFEGDIILTEDQFISLNNPKQRSGTPGAFQRWPNNVIPYVLPPETFNLKDRTTILQSMNTIESRTCIKFVPRTTQLDYITFQSGSGCSSFVGRRGGNQPVTLSAGCRKTRTVTHELIHAVGFFHMQSSADRDQYVKILYENIQPGKEHNFNLYKTLLSFNVPYDVTSIMHYTSHAFSKNQQPTIIALSGANVGTSSAMTEYDIQRINSMYQC